MSYTAYDVNYSKVIIHESWNVIEIGGGANPCPRSNTITNFEQDKNQRGAKIRRVEGAKMIDNLDVEHMSIFKDKEFDFSLCVQVIEHCDDPGKACDELMRVSKSGFIETPSPLCEKLIGWDFHKWLVYICPKNENKLMFEKKRGIDYCLMDDFFKDLFYKDRNQKFINIFIKYSDSWITKFHWKDSFEYEVIE